ncbi:MAG: sigma-70 family RNA polymerase sigma factor, partial [Planctomycetales bacterium]|nr:sigma-70 family RNA polymerase sigma factor [Planctomycetales bacterium]
FRKKIDLIRRSKARRHESLNDPSCEPSVAPPKFRQPLFEELISHLPKEDRSFLSARFRDDKSWGEIAAELDCSAVGVRSRWHRLKQRLEQDFVFRDAANK